MRLFTFLFRQYIYRDSFLYKKCRGIWNFLYEKLGVIKNIKYKRAVKRIMKENDLKQKITELDINVNSTNAYKTYYIIRRDNSEIGLLTYVSLFLGHIAYAVSKGYIPVIDMQNFKSIYLDDEDLFKKNAWEYYFKQPYNTNLDEILCNENYVLSPTRIQPISPFIDSVFDDEESRFWKILNEKFIRLSDTAFDYISNEYDILIGNKKILGLLFRGTDYAKLKPRKHPIQPTIEEFIAKTKELINKWGDYDGIYIATEERGAVEMLEKAFPGKIIVNKRMYYDDLDIDYSSALLKDASFDRKNDRYLKGIEYLSSIVILSKCDSFIGGLCAGTYAANFMNNNDFKHKFFFYSGTY